MPEFITYSMLLSFLANLTIYIFREKRYKYLYYFPYFLALVGILQAIGVMLSNHGQSNVVLYNLLGAFEFCFYFFILYLIIVNKTAKRTIAIISFSFLGLVTLNLVFLQGLHVFNTMSYALGSLLTVAICIYYFFELFQTPTPVNVARLPSFWISSGLLFYYACTFPLFGLANFMKSAPHLILLNLRAILTLLNVLLYLSFTIAFLCRIRVRNSMS